jgi:hypothetical protein
VNEQPQITSDRKKAAAVNISVRVVSVVRRSASSLDWGDERPGLQLLAKEKQLIRSQGIYGQFQVVKSDGRGSGLRAD